MLRRPGAPWSLYRLPWCDADDDGACAARPEPGSFHRVTTTTHGSTSAAQSGSTSGARRRFGRLADDRFQSDALRPYRARAMSQAEAQSGQVPRILDPAAGAGADQPPWLLSGSRRLAISQLFPELRSGRGHPAAGHATAQRPRGRPIGTCMPRRRGQWGAPRHHR